MATTSAGSAPTVEAATGEDFIQLTPKAVDKIRHYADSQEEFKGKPFRIFIEGGGCSGFQYGFTFDDQRDGDTRLEVSGQAVLVDPQSAMYLNGSLVDFVEDLRGAGFVVRNPNASGSCGCGQSFSV